MICLYPAVSQEWGKGCASLIDEAREVYNRRSTCECRSVIFIIQRVSGSLFLVFGVFNFNMERVDLELHCARGKVSNR